MKHSLAIVAVIATLLLTSFLALGSVAESAQDPLALTRYEREHLRLVTEQNRLLQERIRLLERQIRECR